MLSASKFIKNLFSVYLANAVVGILGIISVPVLVNALGKTQYGIFSIYIVLVSYIVLVDLGVAKHFIRLMAADRSCENQKQCIQNALGWYIILSCIILILQPLLIYIVINYIFPIDPEFKNAVILIVILASIEYGLSIPVMLSQMLTTANEEFKKLSYFNISSGVVKYILLISSALIFKNPVHVVSCMIVKRGIDIIISYKLLMWPMKEAWRPKINIKKFVKIVYNASALSFSQILQTTMVAIGSLLINKRFGVTTLGKYRAAFDLGGKIWFFSNGIGMVIFPKFAEILNKVGKKVDWEKRIYEILKSSWIIYSTIGASLIVMSDYILEIMNLGDPEIINFFMILVAGVCYNAHTNVAYEFMLAGGRYITAALVLFITLIVFYAVYLLLLDSFGFYAVAWAWFISQVFYGIFSDEMTLRTHGNKNVFKKYVILGKCTIAYGVYTCIEMLLNHKLDYALFLLAAMIFLSMFSVYKAIKIENNINQDSCV